MHGRQTPVLQNLAHPPRLIPPCLNPHHLLLVALRLTILLHQRPRLCNRNHNRSPNRSLNLRHRLRRRYNSLLSDSQARMYRMPIPGTRITPSTPKIKVHHLHQSLSPIHRVNKMDSNERMVMERPAAKLRSWSPRRSELDTAASAVRRIARAKVGARFV